MDLHHLEYFLQLAQYQHVSQTADLLNISQPSLSKSISLLENELGVKLFDRKRKHIYLNANGEQFSRYVSQALQMLNAGMITMKRSAYETLGTVLIVCHCYAGIITPCVTDYSRLNPLTNFIVCEPAQAKENHDIGQADFILFSTENNFFEQKEQFWVAQPLFQEKYVLVLAPDYPIQPDPDSPVDLTDFKDSSFVTMVQSNVLFNDVTYQLCQNAGFFPKIYCQTDSFLVKMDIVGAGLAVALLPESCLPDAKKIVPGLRTFSIQNYTTTRTIYLMRHKCSQMSEAASDFWDFTLDYFQCPQDNRTS